MNICIFPPKAHPHATYISLKLLIMMYTMNLCLKDSSQSWKKTNSCQKEKRLGKLSLGVFTLYYMPGVIVRFTQLLCCYGFYTSSLSFYQDVLKKPKMCGCQRDRLNLSALLKYSRLTFTASLWKPEQAFVMSYKTAEWIGPQSVSKLDSSNLQPIQTTTGLGIGAAAAVVLLRIWCQSTILVHSVEN